MLRLLAVILVLLVLAVLSSLWLSRPGLDGKLDGPVWRSLTLAPIGRAVTLARTRNGDVLLVTGVDVDGVAAIDLGPVLPHEGGDALDAWRRLGTPGLRLLYERTVSKHYAWEALGMPVRPGYPHIAAGTNYRAHAEEVGHSGEPFLFPKLSHPTAWDSHIEPGTRLDYEVELCAVLLSDHTGAGPAQLGYVLCGDFTDRWLLVRDMDLDGEMGRTGFPLAKGGSNRFPIGPLLLIPDKDDFYRELSLSLYVNDELRQSTSADKMIWQPRQILSRALADCRVPYEREGEVLHLGSCDRVPARTLLLTGTPAGVLFHPATLWNPWAYLREGDVVTAFGTYLGLTQNRIGGS